MTTVLDILKTAMRLANGIASGETPGAADTAEALSALNSMLGQWSLEGLMVYGKVDTVYPTVAGQAQYTVGAGGNWNGDRPTDISNAYCTFGGVDFPIDIIGPDQYSAISLKTQQQPIVEQLNYVNQDPLGIVILFPVPQQIINITLTVPRLITTFTDPATVIAFPPGYKEALEYNLAPRLAAEYGSEISQATIAVAMSSKANVKRSNRQRYLMSVDPMLQQNLGEIWQRGY